MLLHWGSKYVSMDSGALKLDYYRPRVSKTDYKCIPFALCCPTSVLEVSFFERGGLMGRGGGSIAIYYRCSFSLSLLGHSPLHMQNMSCCPPTPAQFAAVPHFFFI